MLNRPASHGKHLAIMELALEFGVALDFKIFGLTQAVR
jgi:hypothetical protein